MNSKAVDKVQVVVCKLQAAFLADLLKTGLVCGGLEVMFLYGLWASHACTSYGVDGDEFTVEIDDVTLRFPKVGGVYASVGKEYIPISPGNTEYVMRLGAWAMEDFRIEMGE